MKDPADVDDLIGILPQLGTGIGLVFALVYAVTRVLHQDDEWERIVAAQKDELARKDAEIAALKAEIRQKPAAPG